MSVVKLIYLLGGVRRWCLNDGCGVVQRSVFKLDTLAGKRKGKNCSSPGANVKFVLDVVLGGS